MRTVPVFTFSTDRAGELSTTPRSKDNCAKHRFYGPIEMERRISVLEGVQQCNSGYNPFGMGSAEFADDQGERGCASEKLRSSKKSGTAHEVDEFSSIMDPWILTSFKEYLRSAPGIDDRERMVKDIEDGNIRLRQNDTWLVNMLLIAACDAAPLISDLPIWLIRNHTDFPSPSEMHPSFSTTAITGTLPCVAFWDSRRQGFRFSFP